MGLDVRATLAAMLAAARAAAQDEWARLRTPLRRSLDEERAFLEPLAALRLDGELDDDGLAQLLRAEGRRLAALLRERGLESARRAGPAIDAALEAFARALAEASPAAARRARRLALAGRRLTARRDGLDFRDLMYAPTLVEVGTTLPLDRFRRAGVPVLDQGTEGACTGFGLAAVAHFLLRTRAVVPDERPVSPRMFYAMARRYDEWRGEAYDGSSCRGAMKGWHKHGVCDEALWHHDPSNPDFALTRARADDARSRPLGAYLRVNHKDLVAMHAALSEVGVLYASAQVHAGWDAVRRSGIIRFDERAALLGGHAFAIVGYDAKGFWIQNSWGADWGNEGFARIAYADWLVNGSDVWVARLGVPVELAAREAATAAGFSVSRSARTYAYDEIRPHVVSLGNDGELRAGGNLGADAAQLRRTLREELPRRIARWRKRRLVLYAHGGLVSEDSAVQRVADYRRALLDAECYPLAFVWHSDFWSTLGNLLREATRLRRPEGALDAAKDFMLDRLDDALEPLARRLAGKAAWDEMKENARLATESPGGGARLVLDELAALARADEKLEIHLVAHSAGAIFHAPLVRHWTALGLPIASCTLWAPACTLALFETSYLPAIESGAIARFALYTLTDRAEQDDDCAGIYNKSLLYLVSNALEERPRVPLSRPEGEPLLGMARFVERHPHLRRMLARRRIDWVRAPNREPGPGASTARAHGAFDDDGPTVRSTLERILGDGAARLAPGPLHFAAGPGRLRRFRGGLDSATRPPGR